MTPPTGAGTATLRTFEGLSFEDVALRLLEQYQNAVDIAGERKGDDREGWLDDARHYKAALGFLNHYATLETALAAERKRREEAEGLAEQAARYLESLTRPNETDSVQSSAHYWARGVEIAGNIRNHFNQYGEGSTNGG